MRAKLRLFFAFASMMFAFVMPAASATRVNLVRCDVDEMSAVDPLQQRKPKPRLHSDLM
jgi:hypothetical protein